MKTNINLKISLVAISWLLLQTQVCAQSDQAISDAAKEVVAGIRHALNGTTTPQQGGTNLLKQLETNNKQIVTIFDSFFKGQFDDKGQLIGPSTLDSKIKNFYSLFTTESFPIVTFPNASRALKNNEAAVSTLQSKSIYDNLKKTIIDKNDTTKALLAAEIEEDANNFPSDTLGISNTKPSSGFFDTLTPTGNILPNINDLIGTDSYGANKKDRENRAKLFVNYLLEAVPPPPSINLNGIKSSDSQKRNIYLPYASKDKDQPYTIVQLSEAFDPDKKGSEYSEALKFLYKNKIYQEYRMKLRYTNVLRSVYIGPILQAYQDRIVENTEKDGKSLAEKEKEAALEGMGEQYYKDLKTKSVADINLETLRAINKLVYFNYKIHKDSEKITLIMAIAALQKIAELGALDENKLLKPIGRMLKNKCWETELSEGAKKICTNPSVSTSTE